LYDAATGAATLWTEQQTVAVVKGIFNVILGSGSSLTLPFDKPYWLGIAVNRGVELTPRIQLTSSAYSFRARLADTAAYARAAIAEPSPGQSFIVRDASGNPTHVLNPSGDVTHNGLGTFLGGISIPLRDATQAGRTQVGLRIAAMDTGIIALRSENTEGMAGEFVGEVVFRYPAASRVGVKQNDTSPQKVMGFAGVEIVPRDPNAPPLRVEAKLGGGMAGEFIGGVDVKGEIYARSIHVVNAGGDTLTSFNADGTSTHKGLETFEEGIKFKDGSIQRTAPTGGASGWVEDAANNKVTTGRNVEVGGNFVVNGTSTHKGLETFEQGIKFGDGTMQTTAAPNVVSTANLADNARCGHAPAP
jgi:hypothetical protein